VRPPGSVRGSNGPRPRSLGERCDDIARLIEAALADIETSGDAERAAGPLLEHV
jgi:hypothetical protein